MREIETVQAGRTPTAHHGCVIHASGRPAGGTVLARPKQAVQAQAGSLTHKVGAPGLLDCTHEDIS
jgi:hypothetical protein